MPDLLLVDDHSIVRTGLKILIKDYLGNCTIDEAENGNSAFQKIKEHNYDLVIMDVNMPDTDSLGTLQTILAFRPSLKIIIFSMNSEEVYAKRYLKLGAMGYLNKHAANEQIKNAISTVLQNKRYISPELNEKFLFALQSPHKSENPFDNLSSREFEIVQHLANGDSVAEISNKLNLHTSTVGTHKARIFEKLDCSNIIELTKLAKIYNVIINS
ncbi:MAG: response regulator [Ginsengibacter sp.]